MTPQEKRKFEKIFAMLDSPHRGERQAALEVIHERHALFGWPSFGDTMRSLSETVPLAQHEQLGRQLAELTAKSSGPGKVRFPRHSGLSAGRNLRLAALAAVAVAVGTGAYQALQPIGATSAAQSNATLAPHIPGFALRNDTTYSDRYGKPITRNCGHYYADIATLDYTVSPPLFRSSHPYVLGSLSWPEVASLCQ
jgi:hypothetical protein